MNYVLRILRGVPKNQYWEEFELSLLEGANIISALMEIRKNPVNRKGERVEPVVWEDGCLEEVCGSCSMLINGVPRQACAALISKLISEGKTSVITLAPMSKFVLVRDLLVDRSAMFVALKRVSAWIEAGESREEKPAPSISPEKEEVMYKLSTCMLCGCCQEACPQINAHSPFLGPAIISQVRFFNSHPTGAKDKGKRLSPLMEEGGITDCGNAQNCVRVCPKKIPLTDSIGFISRDVTLKAFSDLFSSKDKVK